MRVRIVAKEWFTRNGNTHNTVPLKVGDIVGCEPIGGFGMTYGEDRFSLFRGSDSLGWAYRYEIEEHSFEVGQKP